MPENIKMVACMIPTLALDGLCAECRYYSACDLEAKDKYVGGVKPAYRRKNKKR